MSSDDAVKSSRRPAGWWDAARVRRRSIAAYLIFLLLAALVLLTGLRLHGEVSKLRAAPRDNVQWAVAQLEVDLLHLHLAIEYAMEGEGTLDEVRRRFDLLYSRVRTVTNGAFFRQLRTDERVEPHIVELEQFLADVVPLVDGPDDRLSTALGDIDDRLGDLNSTARALALEAVRYFAEVSDRERERFVDVLMTALITGLALIVLLAASLLYIDAQRRISARRAAENERSRRRLRATTNAALDAIVVANSEGRIIDWNAGAARVFGYSQEEARDGDMAQLIIPQRYREAHRAGMKRYLDTGEKRVVDAGRVELSAIRSDGTEFPVELAIASDETEDGPIFISYLRDISHRVAAQAALTEARDAALAADRAKSEFLAVMSHEMRTPLNGVLGMLDLLESTALDERQRNFVETATVSGEVLLRHINDVLDITRIEAGKMSLARERIEVADIIEQVLEIGRPLAEAKGNRVETTVEEGLGVFLGDPHRIRQVLLNLVGNAAKFTENGRIVVDAHAVGDVDDTAEIEISVSDTGCGVAPEDRKRIFDDFVTLDASYERSHSGTGLGLAISRRIITSMGGEIGVRDGPEDGSCFWIRVPLQRTTADPEQPAPAPQIAEATEPKHVLVVEDNEINRMLVTEMLGNAGHIVEEARNGREGVEAAMRAHFDIILMDISMPEMDGIEATRRIRSSNGPCRDVPILGLTAHAGAEERERFAASGMQFCLAKPIRRNALLQQIIAQTGAEPAAPDMPKPREIELIDDLVFSDLEEMLPPERLRAMVSEARSTMNGTLSDLRAHGPGIDASEMAKQIHKLAGTAAVLGAERLHSQLNEIETTAKLGRAEEARAMLADVDELVEETFSVLEELGGG